MYHVFEFVCIRKHLLVMPLPIVIMAFIVDGGGMKWHECIAVYLLVLCGCGYLGFVPMAVPWICK